MLEVDLAGIWVGYIKVWPQNGGLSVNGNSSAICHYLAAITQCDMLNYEFMVAATQVPPSF